MADALVINYGIGAIADSRCACDQSRMRDEVFYVFYKRAAAGKSGQNGT